MNMTALTVKRLAARIEAPNRAEVNDRINLLRVYLMTELPALIEQRFPFPVTVVIEDL